MNNFISWLVTSSANPDKVGIAVRGVLVWVLAQAVDLSTMVCRVAGYCIDLGPFQGLVEPTVAFVVAALTLLGYGMFIFGILRKAWLNRWAAAPNQNEPIVDLLAE
jgi:hypothetical protein